MNARKLVKSGIKGFLEGLREKGFEVWGPTPANGAVEFSVLDSGATIQTDYGNSRLSPKAMVFPQSERMFLFSTDRARADAFILKEPEESLREKVAFAIRPCDARALEILDKVFLIQGAAPDPYYQKKRDRMVLMGLGCTEPRSTCFCHWTGGGPFSKEGLDILMSDLGDFLVMEAFSEKGGGILEAAGLPEAAPEELDRASGLARDAKAAMGEALDPSPIRRKPLLAAFGDAYWERVHEACIKCGTCTYLCPTCSCFDIQDEVRGRCGLRGRNWDSCMFPLTTLHASGHNPRPTGKERFRQRFMHKLRYFFDDFDTIMCVGCGRCVEYCPVNIDIREIIRDLRA